MSARASASYSLDNRTEMVRVKPRSNVRGNLLMGTLSAAIKSKLCYLLILCISCTAVAVLNDKTLLLLVPLAFGILFIKPLLFEIMLVDHVMEASIGYFDWYNLVDDNLYLGALPLEHQDLDRLPNQLGIKAVLSLVQKFELETSTVGGKAVTPQQWQQKGVAQMIIETPDFFPPSFECLDKAAAFLNGQLIQGNKCYCHCKSGKGRSASAVMAYFMRYRGDDVATAFAKMKIARPVVFDLKSSQMKNMTAYAEYLRKGKDASR